MSEGKHTTNPLGYVDEKGELHLLAPLGLRDYFAAQAMQADLIYQGLEGREDVEHVAKMAYQMADTMLKVRG